MRPCLWCCALLSLAGLASCASPQDERQALKPDTLVCEREVPTGSTIPKSTCRTWAEIQADRAYAERETSGVRQQPPPTLPPPR